MTYFVTNDLLEIQSFCELCIEITLVVFFIQGLKGDLGPRGPPGPKGEKVSYSPREVPVFLKKTLRMYAVTFL